MKNIYIQMMSSYAPAWGFGGPLRIMYDYAKWLLNCYEVSVYTGDIDHDFTAFSVKSESIGGVNINRQKVYLKRLVRDNINLVSPLMLFKVASLIACSKAKVVVHVCELRGAIPLYAVILKLLFSNKVVLIHSAFGMLHYKKSRTRAIFDFFLMRSFLRRIDLALSQNNHEMQSYREIFNKYQLNVDSKIHSIPLHVTLLQSSKFRFHNNRKDNATVNLLREKYYVPLKAIIFIFLGRLHSDKGILRTIDSFLEFTESYTEKSSYLLLVGKDFGFKETILKYISQRVTGDKIRIIENVYEERFDYYYLSDVFLGFPTIYEETMLASVEALSCGTPIIVSREADIPYVLTNNAGFVIDYELKSSLRAMKSVVENIDEYQKNALLLAKEKFSSRQVENRLLSLINRYTENMQWQG